jgi:hypothetical protein
MTHNHLWRSKRIMGVCIVLSCLTGMALKTPAIAASKLPKFEVVGRDKTTLSIVVPRNTTSEQLQTLILQFRAARKSNSLSTMIPATTPGGQLGDYAIIWVLVLADRGWASTDNLQRFINSGVESAPDKKYDKEYVKHIKAEYFYSDSEEYGNLGYDDGEYQSPNYKKLF